MQSEWTIFREREFHNNVANQRFNFLLVFSSVVVAAATNTNNHAIRAFVMTFGAAVCLPLSIALYHTTYKLVLILQKIHKDKNSPATIIYHAAGGWNSTKIIGYFLPTLIWLFLAFGAAWAWMT